ncbi:hypothetical protein OHR68_32220 [Spirillospora sp. NBC_00431]
MSNVPPPGDPFPPNGPTGSEGGPPPPPPQFAETPPPTYSHWTRVPIIHLPVMLNGLHVGYLWAGMDDQSAGFIRRNEFLREAYETPFVWIQRLQEAHAQGLPAREAIRQWTGRPEDPVGGGVPADAREEITDGTETLTRLANPDVEFSPWDFVRPDELPDGTPKDRSKGWGPLTFQLPPGYDLDTAGPVRTLPVVKDDVALGYLWVGVTGNAAQFLPREDAVALGNEAKSAWILRLRDLYAQNVPASEILARARALPADTAAGAVPEDATVEELPNLEELRERAAVHEQTMRLSNKPVPGDPDVMMRPELGPGEHEAVLRYLREGPLVYDSRRRFADGYAPDKPSVVPDTYQTDGTWVWMGGVPFSLEHHDIPPEPDLLRHMRDNDFQVPPVDATIRELAKRTLRWHRILVPPPT